MENLCLHLTSRCKTVQGAWCLLSSYCGLENTTELWMKPCCSDTLIPKLYFILYWGIIVLQCWRNFFLYNSESATCMYISSPFWSCLQNPHLTHLGHQRTPGWPACAMQQHPTSCPFYTWQCINVSAILSIQPTLSFPSLCPQVHLLCLHLYSCPASRFIRPFFWISYTHTHTHTYTHTYVCVNIWWYLFFSFWLNDRL